MLLFVISYILLNSFVYTNLYVMELGEIVNILCGAAGGGILTQVVNWRINKKKAAAEAKNAEAEASNTAEDARAKEIENVRKSVEVYQTIIADQNKRISELTEEIQQIRRERAEMERTYQAQIATLQSQIIEINRALGIKARSVIRDGNSTYRETRPQPKK